MTQSSSISSWSPRNKWLPHKNISNLREFSLQEQWWFAKIQAGLFLLYNAKHTRGQALAPNKGFSNFVSMKTAEWNTRSEKSNCQDGNQGVDYQEFTRLWSIIRAPIEVDFPFYRYKTKIRKSVELGIQLQLRWISRDEAQSQRSQLYETGPKIWDPKTYYDLKKTKNWFAVQSAIFGTWKRALSAKAIV